MCNLKEKAFAVVDSVMEELCSIRDFIYNNPEIGGQEQKASALLVSSLKEHGFEVQTDFSDIKYAFRTEFKSSKPGPTVGLFAEYDALPEVGHGCGHNLICTSALGATFALATIMEDIGGKLVLYGTPGEENLETKTILAHKGVFSELDFAIMAHPDGQSRSSGRSRAIEALKVEFFGKTSHAGSNPELGINALDSAVMCYQMINQQKEYIPNTNIHGVIMNGGCKASIIPDYTYLEYLTRAWNMDDLAKLRSLVERCAKSAAESVGCTYSITNFEETNVAMKTNKHLSDVFDKNLLLTGETCITKGDSTGSTDMADVSIVVPAIHSYVGLGDSSLVPHSKELAEKTITKWGDLFISRAAKALTGTAIDVMTNPQLLNEIIKEFKN